ncbi:hypothetical protein ACFL15_01290 [Patescibacteria group bacterium]
MNESLVSKGFIDSNEFKELKYTYWTPFSEDSLEDILVDHDSFSSWIKEQILFALNIEEGKVFQIIGEDKEELNLKMSDFRMYLHPQATDIKFVISKEIKEKINNMHYENYRYDKNWFFSDWIRRVISMGLLRPSLELKNKKV